jgi:hypothetical protein
MEWSKVIYVFFTLMSLTTIAGYLYDPTGLMFFIAASVNMVSTILKMGIRNLLAAELLAASVVADFHLIPAVIALVAYDNSGLAIALAIGAIIANMFAMALVLIESAKIKDEY